MWYWHRPRKILYLVWYEAWRPDCFGRCVLVKLMESWEAERTRARQLYSWRTITRPFLNSGRSVKVPMLQRAQHTRMRRIYGLCLVCFHQGMYAYRETGVSTMSICLVACYPSCHDRNSAIHPINCLTLWFIVPSFIALVVVVGWWWSRGWYFLTMTIKFLGNALLQSKIHHHGHHCHLTKRH